MFPVIKRKWSLSLFKWRDCRLILDATWFYICAIKMWKYINLFLCLSNDCVGQFVLLFGRVLRSPGYRKILHFHQINSFRSNLNTLNQAEEFQLHFRATWFSNVTRHYIEHVLISLIQRFTLIASRILLYERERNVPVQIKTREEFVYSWNEDQSAACNFR